MGASDLPLGVRQRIEQRWSAQLKRQQAERDLKTKLTVTPHPDGGADKKLVELADWTKPRDP